jgi:hypothetical protein
MGNASGWTGLKFKSNDEGIATHVFAAFHPSLEGEGLLCRVSPLLFVANFGAEHNGVYLQDAHIADPWTETVRPWATSPIEAEKLWKLSEKLVGEEFLC